ncbi:hypothetical protein FOZ62_001742, partial [Perkinsus olseni]
IDSWYTQIEKGCADVHIHDRDFAILTFTDDDHLSTRLEGYSQVFTRSTLTLGSEQIFQYTDGDFQLFHLANADSVTAIARCNGQDIAGFFRIFEDRTSEPYLVYSLSSSSSENLQRFKDEISQKCSIPLKSDDLSYFARATVRMLFTQFKGVKTGEFECADVFNWECYFDEVLRGGARNLLLTGYMVDGNKI